MSEHFPLRTFYAEKESGDGVAAAELKPGDYGVDSKQRIESVTPMEDGTIRIVFERTKEQIERNEEGDTIYLKPEETLKVDRGSFHSFTRDTTSGSDMRP